MAPWLQPRSVYIHIPFCAHHCGYCDFAVVTGEEHRMDLYIEALEMEIATLSSPQPVETIFIGGGTPTHLNSRQLERALTIVQKWFPGARSASKGEIEISLACAAGSQEWSIESTPESLTDEKVAILADYGVNRVSLGVQSFDAKTLTALDRHHTADDVPQAIECVRRRIANFSLDLIFGVPGQSLADWRLDLERALTFDPSHVSTYGLTFEKGTPLWKDRERGHVQSLTEDDELAMYELALDTLGAAEIHQYEVSNHARPSFECQHNQTYWANFAYFGFGVGAARYVHGRRELNTRSFETYLRRVLSGESPTIQSEQLTGIERARETLSVQIRRSSGIDREGFVAQTGFSLDQLSGERLKRLAELGLIRDDGPSVRLTRKGFFVADSVVAELLTDSAGNRPNLL